MHTYELTYMLHGFEIVRTFKCEPENKHLFPLCVAASGAHLVALKDITR